MAKKTILQGDILELRQISTPVSSYDDDLAELIADLRDTVTANRGLGLAAPQIGVHRRVFVIDIGHGVQEFVNPVIVEQSGSAEGYESCLSFPEHTLRITRPQFVTLEATDGRGEPIRLEAEGLLARIICHEVDHLDGVLFMDHLDETELFLQILGETEVDEDEAEDDHDEADEGEEDSADQADLAMAEAQERQVIVDTLAELSWKLTLCLEMLEDYRDDIGDVIEWEQLRQAAMVLEAAVDALDTPLDRP
ncbi:peptide deformylase [Alicyclobacillus acidiphilus]|uniref:peptide deformylase n=1 Tax=Alicyclobacillus acidiphilus TaxID=182455 RepID=UPI0009F92D61|nr:peptide deformylase [Alicyclobacillus acidiphilus]